MPTRGDLDPGELTRFLARISLVDVVKDERQFVYRLVGTEDVASRGSDPTGKSVVEAYFGPEPRFALDHYEHVVRYREPYCYRGSFRAPDNAVETEDVIFLPFSADGENVDIVLVFSHSYRFRPRVEDSSVLLRYCQRRDED